jgi:GGDEF domain-containing protein
MLRRSLKSFASFLLSVADERPSAAALAQRNTRVRREQFDRRVRKVVAKRPDGSATIVAGTVQLVGLSDIRKALGDDAWAAVAGKAHKITEATIRSHLAEEDAFDRRDDETYILCFADSNKIEAAQKAERIVARVKERLVEELPRAAERIRVDHEVSEVEWSADEADNVPLIDFLAGSLRKVREEADRAAKQWRHTLVHEATLVYAPLWRPKTRIVPMFRCLLDDATGRTALDRLRTLAGIDALLEATSELDCVMFSHAVKALHVLVQDGGTAALVVPVSFHTLNDRRLRERFTTLCGNMPEAYRQFMIFELRAVPPGIPDIRLIELIQQLKPLGKSVILEMPVDEQRAMRLAGIGLFGFALDLARISDRKMNPEVYLARYARHAKSASLNAILLGVSTLGLADAAVKAEIDYIGGEAIAHSLDAPKNAYHWNPPLNKHIA